MHTPPFNLRHQESPRCVRCTFMDTTVIQSRDTSEGGSNTFKKPFNQQIPTVFLFFVFSRWMKAEGLC